MRIAPEISGVSIVFLGQFNPPIFTPAWFGWQGLLPEGVAKEADLQVAQTQITAFRADWLEFQVVPERCTISSAQSPFVRLQDLAVRIFRENLPHTQLRAMGINRQIHFAVDKASERDRIGRQLAPTEPWGEWGRQLGSDGRHGGMTSLTMTQVNLEGRSPKDQLNVNVQPSKRIGLDGTGVYVEVNDHYATENPGNRTATVEIIGLLETSFEDSLHRSEIIVDHIMSLR